MYTYHGVSYCNGPVGSPVGGLFSGLTAKETKRIGENCGELSQGLFLETSFAWLTAVDRGGWRWGVKAQCGNCDLYQSCAEASPWVVG